MASPNLKRPLSNRPRQRGSPETSKTRELDRGQTVSVFSVEGMVTLELAFSATRDAVPSPLYRARYHSLSRLKDAYKFYFHLMLCVYPFASLFLLLVGTHKKPKSQNRTGNIVAPLYNPWFDHTWNTVYNPC